MGCCVQPPYIVAMVELTEEPDVRPITKIVDVTTEELRAGLEVEVSFEDRAVPSGREDSGCGSRSFARPRGRAATVAVSRDEVGAALAGPRAHSSS
jgi:hypothetical protein